MGRVENLWMIGAFPVERAGPQIFFATYAAGKSLGRDQARAFVNRFA